MKSTFQEVLSRYQGKESNNVPDKVIQIISDNIKDNEYNYYTIIKILKNKDLIRYSECISEIITKLDKTDSTRIYK